MAVLADRSVKVLPSAGDFDAKLPPEDGARSTVQGPSDLGDKVPKNTEQDNWRFCNKCYTLWWNGRPDNGHCPAGGAHEGTGSWNFYLPADSNDRILN